MNPYAAFLDLLVCWNLPTAPQKFSSGDWENLAEKLGKDSNFRCTGAGLRKVWQLGFPDGKIQNAVLSTRKFAVNRLTTEALSVRVVALKLSPSQKQLILNELNNELSAFDYYGENFSVCPKVLDLAQSVSDLGESLGWVSMELAKLNLSLARILVCEARSIHLKFARRAYELSHKLLYFSDLVTVELSYHCARTLAYIDFRAENRKNDSLKTAVSQLEELETAGLDPAKLTAYRVATERFQADVLGLVERTQSQAMDALLKSERRLESLLVSPETENLGLIYSAHAAHAKAYLFLETHSELAKSFALQARREILRLSKIQNGQPYEHRLTFSTALALSYLEPENEVYSGEVTGLLKRKSAAYLNHYITDCPERIAVKQYAKTLIR